ncbi:MAG: NAD(P)/FAD-dependent oxidoreductase [Halobacteriota archaeon]|nr:NAD(P)/FAD-dependent oxidoreductase [Halobacteriota archaeon]
MKNDFDLIVIGGGTTGLPAARMAASFGLKTALVEPGYLAGTCLNYGCTPTKTLEYSAEVFALSNNSGKFGVETESRLQFKKVMGRVRNYVLEAREANEELLRSIEEVKLFRSHAKFVSEDTVTLEEEEIELTSDNFIVATGAIPFVPPVPGLDEVDYLTYRTVLEIDDLPERIVILGGGFIGIEYACIFSRFKSKVTIVELGDRILPAEDDEVSSELEKYLIKSGIEVKTDTKVLSVGKSGGDILVSIDGDEDINSERLLVATGVVPNTKELGLESAGIETDDRGFVKVNDILQSSNKRIYALGDVNRMYMFTHAGMLQSEIAIKNIANGDEIKMDYPMPHAVFSDPEIGSIGYRERDLIASEIAYKKIISQYSGISRSDMIGDTRGFLKLLVEEDGEKILGAHIIGPSASVLIHEFAVLINCHNPKEVFEKTVHIHPTLSELMNEAKNKWNG